MTTERRQKQNNRVQFPGWNWMRNWMCCGKLKQGEATSKLLINECSYDTSLPNCSGVGCGRGGRGGRGGCCQTKRSKQSNNFKTKLYSIGQKFKNKKQERLSSFAPLHPFTVPSTRTPQLPIFGRGYFSADRTSGHYRPWVFISIVRTNIQRGSRNPKKSLTVDIPLSLSIFFVIGALDILLT